MSGKTEAASPRRLKRARETGNIPLSGILVQAVVLMVGVALSSLLLAEARTRLPLLLAQAYQAPESLAFLKQSAFDFMRLLLPWLGALAASASVATLIQTRGTIRFRFSPDQLSTNRDRGLFDAARTIATLLGVFSAIIIGIVAIVLLRQHVRSLANSARELRALAPLMGFFLRRLFWWALGLSLLIGLVDLLVVHRFWRERLRMTRAELRAEQRETGNDPDLKNRREYWRRDLSLPSPIELVQSATLIVHEGDRLAVLLRYNQHDDDDGAPVVLGLARDDAAADVLTRARSLEVPLAESASLARSLMQSQPGELIPEESYDDVAALLRPIVG